MTGGTFPGSVTLQLLCWVYPRIKHKNCTAHVLHVVHRNVSRMLAARAHCSTVTAPAKPRHSLHPLWQPRNGSIAQSLGQAGLAKSCWLRGRRATAVYSEQPLYVNRTPHTATPACGMTARHAWAGAHDPARCALAAWPGHAALYLPLGTIRRSRSCTRTLGRAI